MNDVAHGPVRPTSEALSTVSPLPLTSVTLDRATRLGRWQRLNGEQTVTHCIDELDASGALGNLRRAAGLETTPVRGMWFADSDVYKTLEAALWELARGGDGELATFVDATAGLLTAAQEDDGYLNSWFQARDPADRWANLKWGHELYCTGHLVQAGVAAARGGHAPELVAVARAAADLVVRRFGPRQEDGICGHPEIETALVELYRVTGHRPYLETAQKMIDLRGKGVLETRNRPIGVGDERFGAQYFQDHAPVRLAGEATGHAVRQLYLEAGVVDVAVETGDVELLRMSERRWDDLFGTKTYVTGAHGSRHRDEAIGDAYELPPDRAYAETCAAIASFHWNWRLLLATGRHRYADEMERVLYNAIAGSTAADGTHFFYSNPLQLRAGHDGTDEDAPSTRLPWYGCACCPPNLARLLAGINGYVMTTDAGGVQVQLLTGLRAEVPVPGGRAALRVDSDYPWDGRLTVTVETCTSDEPWTLSVRVPAWSDTAVASLGPAPVDTGSDDGYLRVRRHWRRGDVVTVDLSLRPRVLHPHPHVDAVRGCVALARGPVVYCLEQADMPEGVQLADVRVDPRTARETEGWRSDLAAVTLTVAARAGRTPGELYSETDPGHDGPQRSFEVAAVPYFAWANREPGAMRVWLPVDAPPAAG